MRFVGVYNEPFHNPPILRSSVNASQILTVDKSRLRRIAGRIDEDTRAEVDRAIMVSLGLDIES